MAPVQMQEIVNVKTAGVNSSDPRYDEVSLSTPLSFVFFADMATIKRLLDEKEEIISPAFLTKSGFITES